MISPEIEAQREQLLKQKVTIADLPFFKGVEGAQTGCLLLHGSAASPCNHLNLGERLAAQGYTVLGSLLAGHDTPQKLYSGEVTWQDCFASAVRDLNILSQYVDEIFIIGSSFGGSLAYLLGLKYRVKGVVALSAPGLGRRPGRNLWIQQVEACIREVEQNIAYFSLPALVMHGYDDTAVPPENALYCFQHMASVQKKLIFYHLIGHAVGFGWNTEEVARDIVGFMAHLAPLQAADFELQDQGYGSVSVAGEFNQWQAGAHPMQLEQGIWHSRLALPKGEHSYKFVIDGEHWILDPKASGMATPHGEKNSLKVV